MNLKSIALLGNATENQTFQTVSKTDQKQKQAELLVCSLNDDMIVVVVEVRAL